MYRISLRIDCGSLILIPPSYGAIYRWAAQRCQHWGIQKEEKYRILQTERVPCSGQLCIREWISQLVKQSEKTALNDRLV